MMASFTERLCHGVHHRNEPKRLFLMLAAYADESGTHDGSPRTIMVTGAKGRAVKLARGTV
jgi:hypothetical protein